MPFYDYISYYFFAPNGRFEPCGMFTSEHIISALICISVVAILFSIFKKHITNENRVKGVKITASVLTITEIIKITHSFIYGDLHLDAWFPLSYCGLLIFAAWMSGYGKGFFKNAGDAFITYGCFVAGIAFLIFPTTSLMSFPIWHYFSLYSLFFHSVMIFWGLIYLTDDRRFNKQSFASYSVFLTIFAIPAILINYFSSSNLMNLREPYNIPISFLQKLYAQCPFLYTILVFVIYLLIPIIVGSISNHLKKTKS